MTKQPGSALVVGGGSGIGRATVLALAAAGTRVWAVGRDRARLEQVREDARNEATAHGALGRITPEKFMERFGTPLTANDLARTIVDVSRGELVREGTVVGVGGKGIEPL